MNVNRNSYTFVFSAIMVVVVAALLAVTNIVLKPSQKENIDNEKKQDILKSIGINLNREESKLQYDKYIKHEIVLNYKGEIQDNQSAFDVDLAKELKKDSVDQNYPLYIGEIDKKKKYIIPLRGTGLWGPIWGFIALNEDLNTIYGATFGHEKETPGLGAEINEDFFRSSFVNKKINDINGDFVSIIVRKGGAKDGSFNEVDAISGGTITSDGVTRMIRERLRKYSRFNISKIDLK